MQHWHMTNFKLQLINWRFQYCVFVPIIFIRELKHINQISCISKLWQKNPLARDWLHFKKSTIASNLRISWVFFQPVHPFASFCQKPAHSPTKTQYLIPSYLYIYIIIYQYHACLYTHDNLMKPLPKLSHHTSKKQILYAHIPLDHVTTYSYPIIPSYTHISHYTIQHHSIITPLYHQDCSLGICQHML